MTPKTPQSRILQPHISPLLADLQYVHPSCRVVTIRISFHVYDVLEKYGAQKFGWEVGDRDEGVSTTPEHSNGSQMFFDLFVDSFYGF